jgi:fibro-slime domain-containing protein
MSKIRVLSFVACTTLFFACGSPEGRDSVDGPSGNNGTGGTIDIGSGGSGTGNTGAILDIPPDKDCGDGVLTEKEACDDGNNANEDGCYGNCLGVDAGYTCPVPGELCRPFARCGDGVVAFPEQCDDGGVESGNGCSDHCKVEVGFKCDGAPSTCTPTVCGDGQIEGAETCDDGNKAPFDGCSTDCIAEPNCASGACTSKCGDGIVLGEDCDDGNTLDGDGCSATCAVEAGYMCSQDTDCEKVNDECVMRIPTIFRDFSYDHSDFEEGACSGTAITTGLVQSTLTNGKPVKAGSMSNTNFADWYVTKPGTNVELVSELVLYNDGSGNYVNRYGANGEKWITKTAYQGPCFAGCPYDGNPFFFPVDGIPGALDNGGTSAQISTTEYGMDGGLVNDPSGTKRNFSFTSEVTYWFMYDAAKAPMLEFFGDDDLWVFVNGKLALDVGGCHHALQGDLNLADKAASLGLEDGKVYEIKVFHAERKTTGSSFKLTLSNFSTGRSDCAAFCGDGIIGFGEECDDGTNDGGYNECGEGCKLGAYCGDGVKDEGEECDDGNRMDGDDCGSGCRNVVIK